jgi:cytochrome c
MRHFIGIVSLLVLAACGGQGNSTSGSGDTAAGAGSAAGNHPVDSSTVSASAGTEHTGHPGYAIMLQQDCKTCHTPDVAGTGPSFAMIAARYDSTKPGTVENLAKKVISGGKGSWGDVPMTPHPSISQKDAEELVKYVLSYKN